ncbi:unnamed protein product, partial [Iphiclides podalirius]
MTRSVNPVTSAEYAHNSHRRLWGRRPAGGDGQGRAVLTIKHCKSRGGEMELKLCYPDQEQLSQALTNTNPARKSNPPQPGIA